MRVLNSHMQLVTFGASYCFGHDHRVPAVDEVIYHSRSYVHHLVDSMDLFDAYLNLSHAGAGCETVLWLLNQWIESMDARTPVFVLLEWPPEVRHDHYDFNNNTYDGAPTRVHVHHRWRAEHIILSAIKLLQDQHIRYCMTASVTNYQQGGHMITSTGRRTAQGTWRPITANTNWLMSDCVNSTLFDILTGTVDDHTLHTHTVDQDYFERQHQLNPHMITPCYHPTDEGHRVIAERLKPYIQRCVNGL